jgi:hypothetical protein
MKSRWTKLGVTATLIFLFDCVRDNPFDPAAGNYISGTKPHVEFIQKHLTGFLLDTVTIGILCEDVPKGVTQPGIKKLSLIWSGDARFMESAEGVTDDTFLVKKVLPIGVYTIRALGVDYDDRESAIDSMTLTISPSRPVITVNAPDSVSSMDTFTVAVSGTDSGGIIQTLLWAYNGNGFRDSTRDTLFRIAFSDTGNQSIQVKVRDNKHIESAAITFSVHVNQKSDTTGSVIHKKAPVLIKPGDKAIAVSHTLTIALSTIYYDISRLVFSLQNAPDGATLTRNRFSWTPKPADIGRQTITVGVRDTDSPELSDSVTIPML